MRNVSVMPNSPLEINFFVHAANTNQVQVPVISCRPKGYNPASTGRSEQKWSCVSKLGFPLSVSKNSLAILNLNAHVERTDVPGDRPITGLDLALLHGLLSMPIRSWDFSTAYREHLLPHFFIYFMVRNIRQPLVSTVLALSGSRTQPRLWQRTVCT